MSPLAIEPELRNPGVSQIRRRTDSDRSNVRALTLDELLSYEFPVQETILAPWMMTQSLCMIHAWRGVGKTHVALNIAIAIATGGTFLAWNAPKARRVLYIDGEMPGSAMQSRARNILASTTCGPDKAMLKIITADAQPGAMPDLVTRAGARAVEDAAKDAELIIVDNISTLCRDTGPENEAESWRAPQEWALRMRREGKSVLFIHHSGKNGLQRGSSKREDTLDVVINLERPTDYNPDQGARFIAKFEKFRHGFGADARPFEARLTQDQDGTANWEWEGPKGETADEVLRLLAQGHSQSAVASIIGKNKSTVSRIAKEARQQGLLKVNPVEGTTAPVLA